MVDGKPDEIDEARQLLEGYERSPNHAERARDFADAMEVLNDVSKEDAFPLYRNLILPSQ